MSSPIESRIAGQIRRRARVTTVLSYVTALLTAGFAIAFLLQAGLFQLIVPVSKPSAPAVEKPGQITAGPSTLSGLDKENLLYEFTAETAVQDEKVTHQVHLETLRGTFRRPEEQVFDVEAKQGLYDSKLKTLDLAGDVKLQQKNRFDAAMGKAHVAIREKTLTSEVPVAVTLDNGGTIFANGLKISDDGRYILFLNGVKAKFKASATKGDAQP